MTGVWVDVSPEPAESQVPLHGAARDPRVFGIRSHFEVPRCLNVQVGVIQPRVLQQSRHQRRLPPRVLHNQPVQVGHMEKGVRQAG